MNSSSILLLCFLLTCFTVGVKSRMKAALIFNPITKQLEELNDSYKKCTTCITACPAADLGEQIIDRKASITGNGIFMQAVHKVYQPNHPGSEVNSFVCYASYKPVMVEDTVEDSYKTGYELYYRDNLYESVHLQCTKYSHFKKVSFTKVTDTKTGVYKIPSPVNIIDEKHNTKFQVQSITPETWTFYWIPVLSIQIDHGHQRQISFTKDLINDHHDLDETLPMCKDYNLWDESLALPSRRWQKYQEELLKTNELPNSKLPESSNDKADQAPEIDLLQEVQIMPMSYFHTLSARLATCTFFNVALVLNTVIEQYNLVDSYLYAIYRKQPTQINIIFGTKGLSGDSNPDQFYKTNPQDNIILDKFPIPEPKLLYRIVEYKQDHQIFNAIFVIHNLLYSVPTDERICVKESEVEGWDGMKTQRKDLNTRPELIYVCPVTVKTIRNLKARYEVSENMQTLKLNSFPHFVKETGEIIYQDDRSSIEEITQIL